MRSPVLCCAFKNDELWVLAGGEGGEVGLWSLEYGDVRSGGPGIPFLRCSKLFSEHAGSVLSCAWSSLSASVFATGTRVAQRAAV